MPRMVWGDEDVFDELPDEWDDDGFEPYDGDPPPANIVLRGIIKNIWTAEFSSGNEGLKVLFEAADNAGDRAEYDGWSSWENIAFTPGSAFRYGPLFELLGVTLRDVKTKTVVSEEDNVGQPVMKIGTFKMPKDGLPCKVTTKVEKDGDVRVGKFFADDGEDERRPSRKSTARNGRKAPAAKSSKARATSRRRARDDDDDYDDDDVEF